MNTLNVLECCNKAGFDMVEVVPIKDSKIEGLAVVLGKRIEDGTYATWKYDVESGLRWGHYYKTTKHRAYLSLYERVVDYYRKESKKNK